MMKNVKYNVGCVFMCYLVFCINGKCFIKKGEYFLNCFNEFYIVNGGG